MEFKLSVTNLDEVRAMVGGVEKQARFAMSLAMNRATAAVWSQTQGEVDSAFDRPTPYTRRALRYTQATRDQLETSIGYGIAAITDIQGKVKGYRDVGLNETPAGKYLAPGMFGGGRHIKRFEQALQYAGAMPRGWQAVPGVGARLDGYGNMSRGQIIQILSQLGTEMTAGYRRSISKTNARSRINALRRAGGQFFAVLPGQGKLQPGVYQREFFGRNITPVLIYVRSTAYKVRYPFDQQVRGALAQRMQQELPRAVSQALTTARREAA